MELAIVQERIIPLSELDPVYLDRGTFFGDGVYDVMRSYSGHIFALDDHIARFEYSLREIGITTVDVGLIREKIIDAFNRASIDDCMIYFHITRGSAMRSHDWDNGIKYNFFLTITNLISPDPIKKTGVAVCSHEDLRWKRCDIKSLNLLPNVMAKRSAHEKNCFEAILFDSDRNITEGSSSAFFAVIDGCVVTRPLGREILSSVTRKYVELIAKDLGVDFIERSLTVDEAKNADELFLGVTTRDILGVVKFDSTVIGDAKVGPVTRLFEDAYAKIVRPACKDLSAGI